MESKNLKPLYLSDKSISFYGKGEFDEEIFEWTSTVYSQFPGQELEIDSWFPDRVSYDSSLISWANYAQVNSNTADMEYLDFAMKNFLKPAASLYFEAAKERQSYIASLPEFLEHRKKDGRRASLLYVAREGALEDYFSISEIIERYQRFAVEADWARLIEMSKRPMIELMEFGKFYEKDFADPACNTEFIATGLLLGYPLGSTLGCLDWE